MKRQALEGIKVAELGWAITIPTIGKYLADNGAEVIKIESNTRPDVARHAGPYADGKIGANRSGFFATFNDNKYGITLNLSHPRGLEVAKRIIAWADVVLEGFTAGTISKMGLGYEDLRRIKPDIIMCSCCGLGETGPYASRPALGIQLAGLSGFFHITGWPDREPAMPMGGITDAIGPRVAATVVIAALDYRRRTGKGQYIDVSQYEASIHFLGPLLLDFTVNGRVANRMGNRVTYAAPHGVYPCQHKDRWCAIAVSTDEEWQAFCKTVGDVAWTKEARFATVQSRKQNEDDLDRLVAEWTCNFAAEQVEAMLQAAGVPAGVVKTCQDMYEDPQLQHRQHFQVQKHREMGEYCYHDAAFRLSKTQAQAQMPAPCLGEHNEYVYTKILGMSDQELSECLTQGVFE